MGHKRNIVSNKDHCNVECSNSTLIESHLKNKTMAYQEEIKGLQNCIMEAKWTIYLIHLNQFWRWNPEFHEIKASRLTVFLSNALTINPFYHSWAHRWMCQLIWTIAKDFDVLSHKAMLEEMERETHSHLAHLYNCETYLAFSHPDLCHPKKSFKCKFSHGMFFHLQ